MKRGWWIIIVIILFIVIALFFVRMTGLVVTSINSCIDSDGGKDYWVKGDIRGDYYSSLKEYFHEEDRCKNNKVLIEYYCSDDGIHSYKESEKFECPEGCESGRCLGEEVEVPEKVSILKKILKFFGV